jgi:hypothetical protein
MDINCTSKCAHQVEGKCTLDTLAGSFSAFYAEGRDCPYCME